MNPNAWWRRALRWVADLGLGGGGCINLGNTHVLESLAESLKLMGDGFSRDPMIYRGPQFELPDTCPLSPAFRGCRRRLAPGQWWTYCGETDMGQSLPYLCTECGGDLELENQP